MLCPQNQKLIIFPHSQDLQEVSIPGVVQEDLEAAGFSSDNQRRASAEESLESYKKQRLDEEERQKTRRKRELEEQRLKQEEEEKRKRAAEELRLRELEEERCRKQQEEEEERKLREEAERRRREEEERRIKEEEERKRQEEEERMRREEEERRMRAEEEERRRWEEGERRRLEEQRRKEEEERRKREEEEEEVRRQQELEAVKKRKLKEEEEEERKKKGEAEKLQLKEFEERKKMEAEERLRKEEEEQRRLSSQEADGSADPQERKRRAEELRWKEMEERQPFSFKVSSGEKQILFQKVNLTPVTPASSHQSGAIAEQREIAKAASSEGPDSPNLPTSPYVPHTAILVTGAQLCGTAVNLDQIKDTACKSLLGLGEDRKAQGTPPTKSKTSPDRKSGKTKSLNETSLSQDQSGAAVLAEWASIRSKIFKGVEEGKYDEYPEPSKNQPQQSSEESPAFPHTNLRKTMSASAKFSITPAKKKFGDSNRSSEVFGADDKEAADEGPPTSDSPTAASPASTSKPQNRTSKTVRIIERGSEECMFAKDLPSFLVPSHGAQPEDPESKGWAQSETEASESREDSEDRGQDTEEKPSPFGIKLRRTNYSLRFHSDQSTEKRKKRYSAGDSFDGVPSPLTPIEPDRDSSPVSSDKSTPTSPQREGAVSKYIHASASPAFPRAKPGKPTSPVAHGESEKVLSKPPLYRRPTTSPKPSGAVPTPPPSPLPKMAHGPSSDTVIQRTGAGESSSQQHPADRSEEPSTVVQLHQSSQGQVQVEEEPKEKRSFFPSINIPWREKVDRKTELIRRGLSLCLQGIQC